MTQMTEGFAVLAPDSPLLGVFTIPGANRRMTMRNAQFAFVLLHLATWYDRKIERLDAPGNDPVDEGCYNPRSIIGTNTPSKHAAGVAIDLNWNRHPWGTPASHSLTAGQIKAIRSRVRWYNMLARGTVILWGGNWPSNPQSTAKTDSMHYELVHGLVLRLARILRHTPIGREVLKANPGIKF